MKIVALIEDGHGRQHLVASRSPDLVRRKLSARTGTASLLWCAVPPEHHRAAAIVTEAMRRLGAQEPDALAVVPADRIVKILQTLCVTEPQRTARRQQIKRLCRKMRRWLPGHGRLSSPAQQSRSPGASKGRAMP